jgi:5-(carboxyamino)imidazole ribonucleotide synthase
VRGLDGTVAAYDPGENDHQNGILLRTTVQPRVQPAVAQDAVLIAGRILNALHYVGVIGVEMFVTGGGLVVNEFAPRVQHSGHWTEAAWLIDQFEQHVRAICGWPLGDGARHSDAEMLNLLGEEAAAAQEMRGVRVHLYGKAEARPGRKMGHITRIAPRAP